MTRATKTVQLLEVPHPLRRPSNRRKSGKAWQCKLKSTIRGDRLALAKLSLLAIQKSIGMGSELTTPPSNSRVQRLEPINADAEEPLEPASKQKTALRRGSTLPQRLRSAPEEFLLTRPAAISNIGRVNFDVLPRQNYRPFQHVHQLPDITGPLVLLQPHQGLLAQLLPRARSRKLL